MHCVLHKDKYTKHHKISTAPQLEIPTILKSPIHQSTTQKTSQSNPTTSGIDTTRGFGVSGAQLDKKSSECRSCRETHSVIRLAILIHGHMVNRQERTYNRPHSNVPHTSMSKNNGDGSCMKKKRYHCSRIPQRSHRSAMEDSRHQGALNPCKPSVSEKHSPVAEARWQMQRWQCQVNV